MPNYLQRIQLHVHCTCNRVVVSRHGESKISFSYVEDLDVVVDASAHDLLVVPR